MCFVCLGALVRRKRPLTPAEIEHFAPAARAAGWPWPPEPGSPLAAPVARRGHEAGFRSTNEATTEPTR